MNDLVLKVNDVFFDGWTSVEVKRSIQAIAGQFSIQYTSTYPFSRTPVTIFPGDVCQVLIDDLPVITGHIDQVSGSIDKNAHQLSVSGRDKTADLIDCSAIHTPDEFRGLTLSSIADTLAKPFDISVASSQDKSEPMDIFKIQQGETAFDALDRAARMRGILILTTEHGSLLLDDIGKTKSQTPLIEGDNVLSAECLFDFTERYSVYIVKGQQRSSDEEDDGFSDNTHAVSIQAQSKDIQITRYRPLLLIAETSINNRSAGDRANWEKIIRKARSAFVTVTVQGWKKQDGLLWKINEIVDVDLPSVFGINTSLLISDVQFNQNNSNGTITTLKLTSQDTFKQQTSSKSDTDLLSSLSQFAWHDKNNKNNKTKSDQADQKKDQHDKPDKKS